MLFNFIRKFNTKIPKEQQASYVFFIVYLLMFVTEEVQFIFKILTMLMLLFAAYKGNRLFWGIICFVLSYLTIYTWYTTANHHFLVTYWAWVLFLALFQKNDPIAYIKRNAQMLIGLVMLFAVIQKIIGGYFEGGHLHFRFLIDHRLHGFTNLITRVPKETLQQGIFRYDFASNIPIDYLSVKLQTNILLSQFAYALQMGALIFEGAVAVCFLFPKKLEKYKDLVLILFCLGTYFIFPIWGFANLLIAMAIAQVKLDSKWFKYYIVLYIIMQFIVVPWNEIFGHILDFNV